MHFSFSFCFSVAPKSHYLVPYSTTIHFNNIHRSCWIIIIIPARKILLLPRCVCIQTGHSEEITATEYFISMFSTLFFDSSYWITFKKSWKILWAGGKALYHFHRALVTVEVLYKESDDCISLIPSPLWKLHPQKEQEILFLSCRCHRGRMTAPINTGHWAML